ncbi:CSLREA domain-containing protein [Caldilinea sp.]|jgi:CSLREA domain-containing protein|uniref:CSLREA domain-containing protein n=1 Tax=Caldilinea sp. TaxID=2293560 RepID=UPI00262D4251|nr:CSLREA domain-containing protein [uncultured Caldilinea sp.]
MKTYKLISAQVLRATITILILLTIFSWSKPAQAVNITVTTTNDELNTDGDCSLREAIQAVNVRAGVDACLAGTGNDVIMLPAGMYTLSLAGGNENDNATGDLDVFPISSLGGTVELQGAGAATTIIDGGGIDRVLSLLRSDSTLIVRNVTIRNGQLTDQPGAGILSWGALELRNVIIENNVVNGTSSSATGGGFCIGCGPGTGSGVLEQVIIRNNQADRGGGVFSNRPLTIAASSIISNTARAGGAIENYGDLSLVNSTISGNTATNNIGGIRHYANSLSVLNSTIAYNQRGGVSASASLTLKNTIIAYNTGSGWNNCNGSGAVASQGYNLSNDSTCGAWFTASGDLNNVDPLLGPLQNNGGSTPTHALPLGSPAVNAGTNAGCPATDQRGVSRPQGGRCDIGAFEVVFLYLPLVLR